MDFVLAGRGVQNRGEDSAFVTRFGVRLYGLVILCCGLYSEEPAAPAAPGPSATEGPMDINTAVQEVLKKALAHDGLARGLREACRAIEMGEAELCILAENCDQPDYKKLIEGLCAEKSVDLISVPTNKQLGEWAGVRIKSMLLYFLQ